MDHNTKIVVGVSLGFLFALIIGTLMAWQWAVKLLCPPPKWAGGQGNNDGQAGNGAQQA